MDEIKRFPVNSEDYWDAINGKYSTGLIILGKAGLFTGNSRGIYTLEEVREVMLTSPTEYAAAMRLVTSWAHWEQMSESKQNKPYIERFREEKRLSDRAEAKKLLWESARKGNVAAQKALHDYEDKDIADARKRLQEQEKRQQSYDEERAAVDAIKQNLKLVSNVGKTKQT